MKRSIARIVAVWAALSLVSVAGAAAPRVAVLGGDSPWGDLVVAELSSSKVLTLVEREKLKAVADERITQQVLAKREDRRRVGLIAGADLLVLLSGKEAAVRLVVCDTRLGVTLQDVSVSLKENERQKAAAVLAEQAERVVRQFEGGIKHVVAVPDFVSRDLTFDHSFLQTDYAELLRGTFRQTPGLAIVAVDEARSIAAERELGDVGLKGRPAPLFVEGEYRTTRSTKEDGATTVVVTIRARDTAKVLVERKLDPVRLEQVGAALRGVFAKDLARLVNGGAAIDDGDPFGPLIERADEFARFGEFRRAAALRESALLLKPDADEQRIRLVREYTRRNHSPIEHGRWPKGIRQAENEPAWLELVNEVAADWKRSLQHCEYLVRNRRLCREEATDLAYNAIHSITGVRMVYSKPLEECEVVKKDFLRNVFARIATLDPAAKAGKQGLTGALNVYHFLFESALLRCDGNYYAEDDLDLIADLLINRLPDSMWPAYNVNGFLRGTAAALRRDPKSTSRRFTEQQYLAFLERLAGSDRPLVRIYGRYGKFCYRRYARQEVSAELLAEAKSIVADGAKVNHDLHEHDFYMRHLRDEVVWLDMALNPKPPTTAVAVRPPTPPTPKSGITLEPIELKFSGSGADRDGQALSPAMRWRAAGGSGPIHRYRPLGKGLDALWTQGGVLISREPGRVTEVLADEKNSVDDVITDGRYVWIAASYEWGLAVLDRQGKQLTRVGKEQGLPPSDRFGTVICPLSPGRVLVSGSFGNEHRGWIAIVEFDGTKAKVEVIHEAAKAWDHRARNNQDNLDPAMCFTPEAAFEHVIPGDKPQRIIFILRRWNPLMVDPDTKKVWVYPVKNWYNDCFPRMDPPGGAFLSVDGILWIGGGDRDVNSYKLNDKTGLMELVRRKPNWHMGGVRSGSLARDGDWLYFAGSWWRRVNLRTGEEEVLVDNPRALPNYGSGQEWQIARSDLYGLVAFNGGTLYRVRIEEKQPATKPGN